MLCSEIEVGGLLFGCFLGFFFQSKVGIEYSVTFFLMVDGPLRATGLPCSPAVFTIVTSVGVQQQRGTTALIWYEAKLKHAFLMCENL